jgi:hypothetical protein
MLPRVQPIAPIRRPEPFDARFGDHKLFAYLANLGFAYEPLA